MANHLEKLIFAVRLKDQVTGSVGSIKKNINSLSRTAKSALGDIAGGVAGVVGAGYGLKQIIAPAIDMNKALGEVKSLGVQVDALKKLQDTALNFSSSFGGSAQEFVRSAYDIQSAIAGLSGDELSAFTSSGNLLAKATKADAATITDYMGTMYGIFSKTANKMGKARWVDELTGKTAEAVRMFKTDGAKMAAAFSKLGASATSMGRDINEQMAVLGALQSTMSGSEAATAYRGFLTNIGKAQQALGINLTDDAGKALGMVEILEKLKAQFGSNIDVEEGQILKKAFGTEEAIKAIQLLIKDTDSLKGSIESLSQIRGSDQARSMANAMTDPWEKFSASMQSLQITFGQVLLPLLEPLISSLTQGLKAVRNFANENKTLAKFLGVGVVTVLGLTLAMASLAVVVGLGKFAFSGFLAVKSVITLFKVFIPTIKTLRALILVLNITMLANPMMWLAGAAIVLGAAIAGVIYFWKDLKKTIVNSDFMQWIIKQINQLIKILNYIPGVNIEQFATQDTQNISSVAAPKQLNASVANGGLNKGLKTALSQSIKNQSTNKSVNIGQIVTNQLGVSLEQELLMLGG